MTTVRKDKRPTQMPNTKHPTKNGKHLDGTNAPPRTDEHVHG